MLLLHVAKRLVETDFVNVSMLFFIHRISLDAGIWRASPSEFLEWTVPEFLEYLGIFFILEAIHFLCSCEILNISLVGQVNFSEDKKDLSIKMPVTAVKSINVSNESPWRGPLFVKDPGLQT